MNFTYPIYECIKLCKLPTTRKTIFNRTISNFRNHHSSLCTMSCPSPLICIHLSCNSMHIQVNTTLILSQTGNISKYFIMWPYNSLISYRIPSNFKSIYHLKIIKTSKFSSLQTCTRAQSTKLVLANQKHRHVKLIHF